jgi:Wax ester synthase-like Acyl-CoA acyltransferase domain
MDLMTPTDSVFLMTESREHPMHVGGLQLFQPPESAGPEFVRETYDALVANRDFQPTFRKRPARLLGGIGNVAWAYDDPEDIDTLGARRCRHRGGSASCSSSPRGCTAACSTGITRCGKRTSLRA